MLTVSDSDFEKFKTLIYDKSGIFFTKYNRSVLESRLSNGLKERSLDSLDQLYKLLVSNAMECTNFIDSVTTNLTRFFRNEPHFEAFEAEVLPWLLKKNQLSKKIRIWSAGCSTGEEPYSLALSLMKCIPNYKSWDIKIIASDISLKTLMKAKQGFYEDAKVENVPPDLVEKYFTKIGEGYEIKNEVKELIKFDFHNLLHTCNYGTFDIIFCRNVIIYFNEETQKKVIDIFYGALDSAGFLFLGHSESLFFMETQFELYKSSKRTTLYTKGKIPSPV